VPAVLTSVPITGGRRLVTASGTWEELSVRKDLDGVLLDLIVRTDGPEPGLLDQVRERFPDVVKVRPEYDRPTVEGTVAVGASLDELYAAYHLETHAAEAPDLLMALFREVAEEVADAAD
jgi:hypothetical protein